MLNNFTIQPKKDFNIDFHLDVINTNNLRNKKINYIKTDTCIGNTIKANIYWEEWMLKYIKQFYIPQTNIIDIGANIGTTSLLMSEILSDNNHIFTFEPLYSDVTFKNILDNNLQDKIMLYSCGLSNDDSILEVSNINYKEYRNFGASSLLDLQNTISTEKIKINVKKLDNFDIDNVSLIKIDVENMEILVLEGAFHLINKCKPTILIESHIYDELIISDIFKKLTEIGYTIEPIIEGVNDFILVNKNFIQSDITSS
jgi:FkbM family methyltransferase